MPRIHSYNFENMSAVEIYKLLLTGKIKKFPDGFWQKPDGQKNSKKVLAYLFKEKLKWSLKDVEQNLTTEVLSKYKLSGMLIVLFGGSPYLAAKLIYPELDMKQLKRKPKTNNCKCIVEKCNNDEIVKGYCLNHYKRVEKYGLYIDKSKTMKLSEIKKPLFSIFYDDFDGGCYVATRANNIIGIHDTLGQAKIDVQEMILDLLNGKIDWNYY